MPAEPRDTDSAAGGSRQRRHASVAGARTVGMVTDGAVTAEGNHIHYREAGSGPPVVLLHGGIIDAAHVSWPPVIDRLTPEYRVVAPDLLGYGESEVPPGPYSIQRHAAVVAGVLDELDLGPVTLVGVSVGGGVAMQVALDRPDLVARLVPIDSYGLGRELPNGLLSYALARVQLGNEIAVAAFRRSRRLTRASLGGIVHDLDSLPAAAVDAVYREVQRPTAGVIPGAELTVLGDCAHWAPRENPAAVAEHVRSAISAE